MDESRLLTFNRIMSNFSTKLVGGFIPLVVYKYAETNKLKLAILTIILEYFLSFVFGVVLKKYLIKKPQIFIFLRIIPIVIYQVLLLFVAKSPWLCVIGIAIAYSLSYAFKYIPTEVLFAYVNGKKKVGTGKQLAVTKTLEQLSMIVGVILGGLVLDYINIAVIIVVSSVLYVVGALPLLVHYIRHHKESSLNSEYASYAHIVLKTYGKDRKFANSVSLKLRIWYLVYYFFEESWQAIYVLLPLLTYTLTGAFTYSAIATAIFDGVYGVGCIIAEKINNKKDLTITASILGVVEGVMMIALIFIKARSIYAIYIICFMIAICYSFVYFFMYDRMLKKSKIVGRNITCIINKINMFFLSTCFVSLFGLISLPVAFCVGGGLTIVSGVSIPFVEEKTRRLLVDHLQDNEIRNTNRVFYFNVRK